MKSHLYDLKPKMGDMIHYEGKTYEYLVDYTNHGIAYYRTMDYSNGEFYDFCGDEMVTITGNVKDIEEDQLKDITQLNLHSLRLVNVERCEKVFHKLNDWSPTDWGCAMAGECGEACNFIKKQRRGENISKEEIGKELADVVIYADLLAARLGINLSEAIIEKFNEVSNKHNCDIKL